MRKILIILSLFLVFCKYALTEENGRWICYSETSDGGKYYYNRESINWITGDIVEIWVKGILGDNSKSSSIKKGRSPEKPLEVYEERMWCKIDIKNKKFILLCSLKCNKNGEVLSGVAFLTFPHWFRIIPDTPLEALWKEICELQKKLSEKTQKI